MEKARYVDSLKLENGELVIQMSLADILLLESIVCRHILLDEHHNLEALDRIRTLLDKVEAPSKILFRDDMRDVPRDSFRMLIEVK